MCRVIIAEDEYLERKVLKKIIKNTTKARVVGECNNGKSALELCEAVPCDLILLNLKMGGMDSIEVAQKIRNMNKNITIIITSAHITEDTKRFFLDLGIEEFVLKPTAPKILENIIKKYSSDKLHKHIEINEKHAKKNLKYYPSHLVSDHVLKTLAYIENNYKENITLDSVADQVYLSHHYISRLFKKEVGVTMSSYIIFRKLEEAKVLLMETEKSILDIAVILGFTEQSYFCKVFKKNLGQTPMEFRAGLKLAKNERKKILERYL
ncbi:MAG: DNA-binding response regulator [Defluviitaleaceae bacterium]|nr:DNA-binding response regulator [Defluviitaleaceae bacterium]